MLSMSLLLINKINLHVIFFNLFAVFGTSLLILYLNKNGDNGDLIQLYKSGTHKGNIGIAPHVYLSHQDGKGTVSGVIVGGSFDDDEGYIKLRVTDSTGITPSLPLRNERSVYFKLNEMSDEQKANIQKEARERNEARENNTEPRRRRMIDPNYYD